jgi:hypothetical protein
MAKKRGGVGGLVAIALVVWVAAGFFAWRRYGATTDATAAKDSAVASGAPTTTAAPPAAPAAPPASSTTVAASAATAAASAATAPPASSKPAAPAPQAEASIPADTNKCVAGLFPEGSFKGPADFAFVCLEANAPRGGLSVKARLIHGADGNVTDAMREWAGLEWYEMAAFSFLRARCCARPVKLAWRFEPACPLQKTLDDFEAAVRARDDAKLAGAVEEYTKTVRCLNKLGQSKNFGYNVPPGAGATLVGKMLERNGHRL